VDAAVFQNYVRSVGEGFLKWGLDHIIFMNGHGGNVSSLSLAGEQLADQGAKVLTMNWWLDYSAEIKTVCQAQGHAGEDETSTVLAIEEKLVDMKLATENWARLRGNIKWKGMGLETYVDALSGDARLATREKGEKIYELLADRMYELITCFQRDDFMLRG
jgi:creatinine amidohydrolase